MIKTPVQTTQVAPTIILGIDPENLHVVRQKETGVLTGLFVEPMSPMRLLTSE